MTPEAGDGDRSHLYLLVFPLRGVFKVGKANDIHHRMRALQRTWGGIDAAASYHVAADRNTVFKLERTLGSVLADHAVAEEVGDGRTELFALGALDLALKQIELCSAARKAALSVVRGLPSLPLSEQQGTRRVTPEERFIKEQVTAREMTRNLARTAAQFDQVNRLLILLARCQHKIAYQYEFKGGQLSFRIRTEGRRRLPLDRARQYLRVECYDQSGQLHTTLWEAVHGDNHVDEYSVTLPWVQRAAEFQHPVLCYLWSQTERILANVPRRSAALGRRTIPPPSYAEERDDHAARITWAGAPLPRGWAQALLAPPPGRFVWRPKGVRGRPDSR
jgi:hypothetical protein